MPKALGCEGGRQDSEQGRAVCPSLVTKGFSEKKTPPPTQGFLQPVGSRQQAPQWVPTVSGPKGSGC